MISQQKIIEAIDKADTHFVWCWEGLQRMRRQEMDPHFLIDFQVRLCRAFAHLDQIYRMVKSEQAYRIANKARYKSAWFKARMKKLESYLKVLREALGLGRSLGDGFAWIFYRNEDALMEAHSYEERQLLLPPNVGGLGERIFVENMQGMGGMFVLYHGITSFLRLGDVSFFDPKTGRITTIGELKTRHLGGERYSITLGFVGEAGDNSLAEHVKKEMVQLSGEINSLEPLDKRVQQKLNRQVSQITEALKTRAKSSGDIKINQNVNFHFEALETVTSESHSRELTFNKAGPGVLLASLRPQKVASLGKRLLRSGRNINRKIEPVRQAVNAILDPKLPDNCLFVDSIGSTESGFPIMLSGSVPFVWWPIKESALYDLLFGHVLGLTLFNPAQLWALLRSEGFTVVTNDRSKVISMHRPVGDRASEIHNFTRFHHLVQYNLMDEHAVVEMIKAWVDEAEMRADGQPIAVGLKTKFRM